MTTHEEQVIDAKLREVDEKLRLLETIRGQIEALGRKGNRESAFMAGRRSMAYERASSGGVGAAQLGQEILFLLPDEFVDFYGELFHQALRIGDGNKGGDAGVVKAKGNTGTVTGSDTRLQASGSGKRYKLTPLAISDEAAMVVKDGVDKELRRLTNEARDALRSRTAGDAGLEHSRPGASSTRREDSVRPLRHSRQCPNTKCRSFLKADWEWCPRCGSGCGWV